ncbi:MAG: hypothetical protein KAH38_03180 [Candidatus Hydrogenedentes bacterium]|nr:hypothetical protein [Candidatus Hydrogenedentota bacterium]
MHTSAAVSLFIFLVFGIWSLHKRFQKIEEWHLHTQLFILLGVVVFYWIEIPTLHIVLRESVIQFIFALLGLLIAGLALYGHIVVSVVSRLLVEILVPDNPAAEVQPRLGPAEALEQQQDWEGALNEYSVLSKIYPRNAMLSVRAANVLLKLNRNTEAALFFERAIKYTDKAEDNLMLVRRLCDVLELLGERDRINAVLRAFVERFPEHETSKSIMDDLIVVRDTENGTKEKIPVSDVLLPLADTPISQDEK